MNSVLLCDASYDDDYGLAGYAGTVTVDGKQHEYKGAFGGVESSNEAELYAVYEGLKQLVEHDVQSKIRMVSIFSDSNNALDRLKNKKKELKRTEFELFLLRKIRKLTADNDIKMVFHHVKGHQNQKTATVMEKRHNVVDKIAYKEMTMRRELFNKPDREGSQYYGVVVDANPPQKLANHYEELGYKLAKSSMHARVHIQGKGLTLEEHPLYKGIMRHAKEEDLPVHRLVSEFFFADKEIEGYTDRMLGCQGLDSCLLRKSQMEEGKDDNGEFKIDKRSVEANASGGASRLLFGYQARVRGAEVSQSMYAEKPSLFTANLVLNKSKSPEVTDWLYQFSKMVNTPYFRNMKDLDCFLADENIVEMNREVEEAAELAS